MQYIEMAEDLVFSRLALGFWRVADLKMTSAEIVDVVEKAIDLGITTFDHADIYGNYTVEKLYGDALAGHSSRRDKLQIVGKATIRYPSETVRVKYYDTSEAYLIQQVEQSLRDLRTDYLDLFLLHRPNPYMDPESTARAFSRLKADGKVRHFGVSNYTPSDFDMLASFVDVPLITNQIEVSVLQHQNFDNGVIAHAQQHRIHPMVWSPLAGGRIFVGEDEASLRVRAALETIRDEIGAQTIDEVAFAWLYSHPVGLVPITGSYELEYLRRPISAQAFTLSPEHWFWIWSAATGHKIL